jgi:hypothetical protein
MNSSDNGAMIGHMLIVSKSAIECIYFLNDSEFHVLNQDGLLILDKNVFANTRAFSRGSDCFSFQDFSPNGENLLIKVLEKEV